jgi:uncharacterized protein YqjF (DUF2071 family)
MSYRPTFLTARWRYLFMANYPVAAEVLEPYLPEGVELDRYQGRPYVSLVGFLFWETKVLGIGWPGHRNFEEVNLRFYVKRQLPDGSWRRGVVFVSEIVPLRLVAWVANTLYGEQYQYAPMDHTIEQHENELCIEYAWRSGERWNQLRVLTDPEPVPMQPDSAEEFIFEHYWGYASGRGGTTEYQVEHPAWRVFPVRDYTIDCDVAANYGEAFVPYLDKEPASVFLAEGSEVGVRWGRRLR